MERVDNGVAILIAKQTLSPELKTQTENSQSYKMALEHMKEYPTSLMKR